jgi:DMSO/TMAO reductase YedYZ molybdopterin-dependent catalytic subunit
MTLAFMVQFFYPQTMKFLLPVLIAVSLLFACAPAPETPGNIPIPTLLPSETPLPTPIAGVLPDQCNLPPVVVPTLPAVIPAYAELDESAGLHVTGVMQEIDPQAYRLKINGKVDFPLSLTLDDLRCMPKVTETRTIVCPGVFEDVATFSGVPLMYVLGTAGIQESASKVVLVSADGYEVAITLADSPLDLSFLAYELDGKPLPPLHGFPLRMVAPTMPGANWVKWLVEINVE